MNLLLPKQYPIRINGYKINSIKSGMLLEPKNSYIVWRFQNNYSKEILKSKLKFLKMTAPFTTTSNYNINPEAATNEAASYTQQEQKSYLIQHQHLKHIQHNLTEQNITTTSPLQHLNNIFGLNLNSSPPVSAITSTTSPMYHHNNLQLLFGVTSQQQQQFQQIYQDLYSNILPQQHHHQERVVIKNLMEPTNVETIASNIEAPLPKGSSLLLKNETQSKSLRTLTVTAPPLVNSIETLSPLETVSLNHRLHHQQRNNDGNMASLERQVNETGHAKQRQSHKQSNNKLHKSQTTLTSTLASMAAETAVAQTTTTTFNIPEAGIKPSVENLAKTYFTPAKTTARNNFGKLSGRKLPVELNIIWNLSIIWEKSYFGLQQ